MYKKKHIYIYIVCYKHVYACERKETFGETTSAGPSAGADFRRL